MLSSSTQALPADLFGLSDVARAAISAGPAFGPIPLPRSMDEVPRPEERLGSEERGALADSIAHGLEKAGLELAPAAATSLNDLRKEGTFCVVTGQQPGFLASPLYSLYKALQACRAAEELSALWGAPVVPIFWNHADDHDVAEVHHAWQLNRNLDLQKVALAGLSSGRVPLGDLTVTEELQRLGAVRSQLHNIVEEHAGADRALDLFMPRDGETLPRALSRIFGELCGRFGLVVVEPDWIRAQLSSEMGRIVSGPATGPTLVAAMGAGEAELESLGLKAAIAIGSTDDDAGAAAAIAYRHVPSGSGSPERVAIRAGGEGLRMDGEPGSRTHAELGSQIVSAPGEWSAGALLRPIVQDAVFPTCAYVGGYGELGYHAQLGPARDAADQPRTPFLARVSLTIVDDDTRYALHRVEASAEEVLRAKGEYTPADDDSAEPEVISALREIGAETARRLVEHKGALAELEPALAVTIKKTAGHVEQSIGKVIEKALRVHQNRSGKGARQVRRVNSTLVPRGVPQERVLGPFQFFARFGTDFIEALRSEIPSVSFEHIVLHLESEQPEGTHA